MFNFNEVTKLKRHYVFAFDLHGVIDTDPEGFLVLFKELKDEGCEIHVVSGPRDVEIRTELVSICEELLDYIDATHSIVDFLKKKGVHLTKDEKGMYWTNDINWWSTKAQICEEIGADYMIDDTYTYEPFFINRSTQFIHVKRRGT